MNALYYLGETDLHTAVTSAILHATHNHPRSQQAAIGPSEVGEPCARRLAYKLLGIPRSATESDPWRATVGTAAHAWLADALTLANTELGYTRWIVEDRVTINEDLAGSCDAYDTQTGTVVDWKIVGPTSMKKYKRGDPGQQYRTQVHLYGAGHANAGRVVNHVAIVFLPAAGELTDAIIWTEPFDQGVADTALLRLNLLRAAATNTRDAGAFLAQLPKTPAPGYGCRYCPWISHGSNDLAAGCPGVDNESNWIAGLNTTQPRKATP